MPDPTATLTLHRTCAPCNSTGAVPAAGRYYCAVCFAAFGAAERLAARPFCLPCGHVSSHLAHGARCTDCHGLGVWDETVTLANLAAWFREQCAAESDDGMPLSKALALEQTRSATAKALALEQEARMHTNRHNKGRR